MEHKTGGEGAGITRPGTEEEDAAAGRTQRERGCRSKQRGLGRQERWVGEGASQKQKEGAER